MEPTIIELDYKKDNFYYNNELIFQIIDSPIGFNMNEKIKTPNQIYIIKDIIHNFYAGVIEYYLDTEEKI